MIKITLSLLCLFFTITIFAQEDLHLARVQKVNGVEAYIMAKPIREYEEVFKENNKIQWGSALTEGLANESIAEKLAYFVRGVQQAAKKDGVAFDAILYTDGKNVKAIRFTDEETRENDQIAIVNDFEGIPVFIMNEPLADFTVEEDKGPGMKWKSFVTGGLINNSIEQDVKKYTKRFKKEIKKNKIDAIQYTSGKDAIGIKFSAQDMASN
tara:strand:- start:446 stop:1078 length:633 start_codon:yes stop_codon:yes gene_type:complete